MTIEILSDKDIKNLSFEDALEKLETIVKNMEQGNNKLDDAINAYEQGIKLQKHCQFKLNEAQLKLEKMSIKDGEPVLNEVDME